MTRSDPRKSLSQQVVGDLLQRATLARQNAYAPYSRFAVGAALLTTSNDIFVGCNVENATYGATICAERTAAVTAIAAGFRKWTAIAIVLPGGGTPCGICRQFLAEFSPGLQIYVANASHPSLPPECFNLDDLFPVGFAGQDVLKHAVPDTD